MHIDVSTWGWPQLSMLALSTLGLGISIASHGQPETGKKSFWTSLLSFVITYTILGYGGFFGHH